MNDDCELVNRANRDRIFIITSSEIFTVRPRFSKWFYGQKYEINAENFNHLRHSNATNESIHTVNVWK